jgi:ribosomal protein S18 acetylase RimI-like enzyme
MIEYCSLENTSLIDLHTAFLEAFSDYQVQMNMPFSKFENMLHRRGYAADLSVGALLGNELVGFVLNGCRLWNDINTLYDCGTGVVPKFRKQGITTNLFKIINNDLLEKKKIEQYLLEVIQTNTSAVELYKKQGFAMLRSFSCYRLEQRALNGKKNRFVFKIENLQSIDWSTLGSFWDVQPSWQNSIDSVLSVPESFLLVTAKKEEIIIGYGIIDIQSGDIAQMAVHKHYRRQGVGTALIDELWKNTESSKVSITNVDDRSSSLKAFLNRTGFQNFIQQYEMVLTLKKDLPSTIIT